MLFKTTTLKTADDLGHCFKPHKHEMTVFIAINYKYLLNFWNSAAIYEEIWQAYLKNEFL